MCFSDAHKVTVLLLNDSLSRRGQDSVQRATWSEHDHSARTQITPTAAFNLHTGTSCRIHTITITPDLHTHFKVQNMKHITSSEKTRTHSLQAMVHRCTRGVQQATLTASLHRSQAPIWIWRPIHAVLVEAQRHVRY